MSPMFTVETQWAEALDVANRVRLAGSEVRKLVVAGDLDLADALFDERAQRVPIGRLLLAKPHWGQMKANKLLRRLGIYPGRRVGELTDRQKRLIAEAAR